MAAEVDDGVDQSLHDSVTAERDAATHDTGRGSTPQQRRLPPRWLTADAAAAQAAARLRLLKRLQRPLPRLAKIEAETDEATAARRTLLPPLEKAAADGSGWLLPTAA